MKTTRLDQLTHTSMCVERAREREREDKWIGVRGEKKRVGGK